MAGPAPDLCTWVRAADGVRLRVVLWRGGGRGLVALLQGRAEFVEKYGPTAQRLTAMGFSVAALDWRGQGLSDRNRRRPMIGHVRRFLDYQTDLAALLAQPAVAAEPGPRVMLAHSMGGCIGLRALLQGLPAAAAVFSAPMWGIRMGGAPDALVRATAAVCCRFGLGRMAIPGGTPRPYLMSQGFEGNVLTSDPEEYTRLLAQVAKVPELGLGDPSIGWLRAALIETAALRAAPQPETPILTILGGAEVVVSPWAVRTVSARQKNAELLELPGARHEVMIETPALQARAWAAIGDFLDRVTPPG
ncbi:alpha/beta hydrolase [Halovulum marinum]|uniref:alpha/beta hydrolase n=1 Tax=Halovulum marinum TaxID=2662447 RepID=UPI002D765B24|nr:alpha/beta hydrolase [Halovulum marinum]